MKKRKTTKTSFDMDPDITTALDDLMISIRQRAGYDQPALSRGYVINYILGAVLCADPTVKHVISKTCLTNEDVWKKQQRKGGSFMDDKIRDITGQFHKIRFIFNDFNDEIAENTTSMRRIDMSDGSYVVIPDEPDWTVINESDAASSTYAYVFEILHGEKYNAPHLVYFTNCAGPYWKKAAYEAARKFWQPFSEIEAKDIDLQYDSNMKILNMDEYNAAPHIGLFRIGDAGIQKDPPYGAMVYRNSKN